ncbi:YjcZ family sporulation protein [Neobacillus sp. SAB-20_R2A]|uniref:YjcZ family sporulation protein n=1 Tax=Neobacillus sp. SAB-20_R2A TaxID=3120519 RepID=UPI003C6DD3BA
MYHGYGFDGCCGGYGGGFGYGGYGGGFGFGYGGFALIVVLFILLIIIGASWAY